MTTYQPSEAEWNMYGTTFATTRFWSLIVGVALWGIQVYMAVSSVSTFWKLPTDKRKGHLRLLAFSTVILVASSVNLVIGAWLVFHNLFSAGPNGQSYIDTFYKDLEVKKLSRMSTASGIMGYTTISVGDILLLWRCYMMWNSRRWVIILPSLACTGSIVARITSLILQSSRRKLMEGAIAQMAITADSFSVSVNVMVTGLILFKLWGAWTTISKACPDFKRPRIYSSVTSTLIESAAPLAVFGVCYVSAIGITYYQRPEILYQRGRLNALSEVSGSLFYSFSALSPQMIIFRVLNGQSWKNARESNEFTEKVSTTFRFQRPGSPSNDDV